MEGGREAVLVGRGQKRIVLKWKSANEDGRAQFRDKEGQRVVRSFLLVVCCKGCVAFFRQQLRTFLSEVFIMRLHGAVGYEQR